MCIRDSSEGEQREEPGGGGRDRGRPQYSTGKRDAEGPAPPPPQRKAGQRSAREIDDQLRGRQQARAGLECRAQEERPERGREEAPGGIQNLVATGPRTCLLYTSDAADE